MENQTYTPKRIKEEVLRQISIEEIGPSSENVVNYSLNEKKQIDIRRIEYLEGRFGWRCDVVSGKCSCGLSHELNWLNNKLTPDTNIFS
ncbi:MAG: hypothetical protein AABY32_04530 [Nanoarchaeota archaeon]